MNGFDVCVGDEARELTNLLAAYRDSLLAEGKSKGTISQRTGDIRRLAALHRDLRTVSRSDLVTYFARRAHWAPEYRKKVRASFRSFYSWAFDEGLTATNPALVLKPVAIRRARPRPAPDHVIKRAFKAGDPALRAMIALAAVMGLRRSEIASLHPSDREGNLVRIRGKGDHTRVLTLDSLTLELLTALEAKQGRDSFYFPGRFGSHLHHCTIYKAIKDALGPEWSPHNLRHRAATMGFAGTKNIRAVQEFLGHASVATTQLYVDTSQDDIAAVAASASMTFQTIRQPHVAGRNRLPA